MPNTNASDPTTPVVAPPVLPDAERGTVADTRRSVTVDLAALWVPPAGYVPLDKASINALSKIAATQGAELSLATRQVIDKTSTLATRFGELAPDTTQLAALWERYQSATSAYAIAEQQSVYFGDIAQVALHDVLQILGRVDETVRPVSARNAQVAAEFSAVLTIADQRGDAVREGRARAKADKSAAAADDSAATDPSVK